MALNDGPDPGLGDAVAGPDHRRRADHAGVSLYDSTCSRTVWRLYDGAKGLAVWYYQEWVVDARETLHYRSVPLYTPTFSRTVWWLYGGAKGLAVWCYHYTTGRRRST